MIKVTGTEGIDSFIKQLDLEWARLDREISAVFYRWTTEWFGYWVEHCAQFSGDMTSNCNYSVNAPDNRYVEWPLKYEYAKPHSLLQPHEMGDPEAVGAALARMSTVTRPTWHDSVWFTNATPVAELIEGQQVLLRPVNLVQGQAMTLNLLATMARAGGLGAAA